MKPYAGNPRIITKAGFKALSDSMRNLGDLSGIVHNIPTDEVISANQRCRVIGFDEAEILVEHRFDPPTELGTVATGYVLWEGEHFSYRAVRWDDETCERANIQANALGGTWDWVSLSALDTDKILSYGLDEEAMAAWNENASNWALMMESENDNKANAGGKNKEIICPHCGAVIN